ncbi:MAG: hypothetical protein JXP34_17305 [Planctomycetes bacterium]|nr:hypothetical protein [Planctomycetota bacterium]
MPARRTVGPTEASIGISLIAILVLAGIGIGLLAFLRGPYYERALTEQEAAEAPAPAPSEGPGNGADPLPPEIPEIGWQRSEVERYTPETLFEKIDGRDQAYLDFDVAGLRSASYRNPAEEAQLVDLYVYDMGNPLHALGIFGAERAGSETLIPIGDAGYQDESSVFFRKGRFYVQSIGSLPDPAVGAAARALAVATAASLPAEAAIPYDFLPAEGRIAGSEGFALRNAFYVEGLDRVFLARYGDAARPATLFAADCGTAEKAGALLAAYIESSGAGATASTEEIEGVPCRILAKEGGTGAAFAEGSVLGGVLGAAGVEAARRLLASLIASVRTGIPKDDVPKPPGPKAGGEEGS